MQAQQRRRRKGAVLVVTLVALALLVGLVFFVFNLGDQVNNRLVLQNAADSAAVSGGTWMARSMNVLAMNNTGQAKMIALAMVLDAVPLAAELAFVELDLDRQEGQTLGEALGSQLSRGVPETRLEQAYPRSASFSAVVADAILVMPELPEEVQQDREVLTVDRGLFSPLWPGMGGPDDPNGFDAVEQRIGQHGTVLDNRSAGFSTTDGAEGGWAESDAVNEYQGSSLETLAPDATATFVADVPADSERHHLYAWWSSDRDGVHRCDNARYTVTHAGGTAVVGADQNRNSGAWIYLGTYSFPVVDGSAQVRVTLQGPPPDGNREQTLTNFFRNGLEKLHREMLPDEGQDSMTDYEELLAVDEALNSSDEVDPEPGAYDVTGTTHWQTPDGGRGTIWQAALAMRDVSRATVESAGALAQRNAGRFGKTSGGATAFLVPGEPAIPFRAGSFEDFTPVLTGRFTVRLGDSGSATLELPIHQEVARINNLDLSLDDCASMFDHEAVLVETLDELDEELALTPNWEDIDDIAEAMEREAQAITNLVGDIEARLDEGERLAALRQRLETIDRYLRQLRDEADHDDPSLQTAREIAEQLRTQIEGDEDTREGLDDLIYDEEEAERTEKESRLANLHNACPGGGIGDYVYPHRLGPYAQLHRWRHNLYEWTPTSEPGWGGDPEVGASRQYERGDLEGFVTYGPYRWALDEVTRRFGLVGSRTGDLDTSRFSHYTHLAANIKLGYVYGVQRPQQIRYITRWITDYNEAKQFAENLDNRRLILRTRYYRPVVTSSVSWDHPHWLKDLDTYWCEAGHCCNRDWGRGIYPPDDPPASLWVWEPNGWWDVAVQRPEARKTHNHVWRWQRQYDVEHESRVHLYPRLSAETGEPIPWKLYICSWYVFGGIQVAEAVTVANPCNWPDGETDLPTPLLYDATAGDYTDDHDAGVRRSDFTLLGIASYESPAKVWPSRFTHGNPSHAVTTVAQAEVFNNLSWDLWTQNWQAQLVPVTRWEDWMARLPATVDSAPAAHPDLDPQQLQAIQEYLDSLPPELVNIFMNH
jgi:hypothetical protein